VKLQAGKYIWQTYQQTYETVILIGSAMRHIGVEHVSSQTHVLEYNHWEYQRIGQHHWMLDFIRVWKKRV
jgi:long-subunit acyl-CoA synthetase (AMP-forming)